MSLTEKIKEKAGKLGFTHVGISSPRQDSADAIRLQNWLDGGYHASMRWIEKRAEERKNVYAYFPEVRSVISVTMNYYTGNAPEGKKYGKLSNYAWGDDYHVLMKDRLFRLLEFIRSLRPQVLHRVSVDTSPVMDRVWARQAGIGWIGKNTNLITRDHGSWLFLGELMTDIDLEPDRHIVSDHCGSCTACLDACPTNAFPQPYVLDARKCISFLTIEHRGEIPGEAADKLDGWIFGCDICQQVCPWNQTFHKVTEEPAFQPRADLNRRSLDNWKDLTENEFKTLFRKSPVKRTKYTGLKRNIKIALKNVE